jgi:hypothetical protein
MRAAFFQPSISLTPSTGFFHCPSMSTTTVAP